MNPSSLAPRPPGSTAAAVSRPGVDAWAAGVAIALLLALGAGAIVRWTGATTDGEEIVQLPIPDAPPSPRQETAPDPGD